MITLSNVTINRGGRTLFKDFNLIIDSGENYVISGKNGGGKTILLEALSGEAHLASGEITYDFINSAGWDARHKEKKNKIKFIRANAATTLTKNQSSFYYQQRYYAGESGSEKNIGELIGATPASLDALGLPVHLSISHLLELDITRLSNGQLKKVLITAAFLSGIPKLLLLDYPFEGLDTGSRADLVHFMTFLFEKFKTQIILVDHYHPLSSTFGKRLIIEDFKIIPENKTTVEVEAPDYHPRKPINEQVIADPIIDLQQVNVRYGDKTIIDNLSWRINRGERWALTGNNGAGKTTLFSMIFADHPQAYGQEIFLFGRKRGTGESIWDIKKRIAYLGPEVATWMNSSSMGLTGLEYLKQLSANPEGIDQLIDFFGASDFIHQHIRVFSSGQLQLLHILHSFMSRKELILLDEPFQFLDPEKKLLVKKYLHQHLDESTTLILITHYPEDIDDWSEHILRL